MKKDTYTSHQLFGIFFLREQLHSYLDVFEERFVALTQELEFRNVIVLINNKRVMLGEVEEKFQEFDAVIIEDTSIFYPLTNLWLNAAVMASNNVNIVMDALLSFDKKVMAWCYLFMVNEDIGLEFSAFLLRMIEYAKANSDYLLTEISTK